MNHQAAIEHALTTAGLPSDIQTMRNLSGGCIHTVLEVEIVGDLTVVAKVNDAEKAILFEEESQSLAVLSSTNTVFVPKPLAVVVQNNVAVFLMSALTHGQGTTECWSQFGYNLAALYNAVPSTGESYGFESDNHLGTTPQPNGWCQDWVEFNRMHRLGFQVETASKRGLLLKDEIHCLNAVIENLQSYIPAKPQPSLLHGDLWSGNALPAIDEHGTRRIAILDPACYIGDGWADLAMMKLFGGFPDSCFAAYESSMYDHDNKAERILVYQLYHVLNHVNIFGRGYVSQAIGIAKHLIH